jgi:SAM-dependent methyltransferase
MDRTWYPAVENNWDDRFFRERILERLRAEHHVLDVGAGAGIVEPMRFKGLAARVAGVDPSERVLENPHLDEAAVGVGEHIPHPDESFDLVFSDNVLEHLEDPSAVFREVARVLKPGGWFFTKTPNRYHYVALIAQLTPHRFHQFYNSLRGRAREDTFPTLYRANTKRATRRHARAAGLEPREFHLIEGRPEYLRLSPLTYLFGWLYERLVNSSEWLAGFRVVIIAAMQKPE